mmetsp:Transcript_98982/g.317436  ORF Transcript_98982/g.317436 Transcript_98982/m.317436 type:complete len:223 (-) Transcript_98982:99-767(-)
MSRLGARVECSCPDFAKSKSACKHLIFVLVRVLEVPRDDPRVWQRALLPREVRDLRERLQTRCDCQGLAEVLAPESVVSAFEAMGQPAVRQPLGRPCPVCLDAVAARPGAACCAACGANVHDECLAQHRGAGEASAPRCPACRAPWLDDEAGAARAVVPGRPLPRRGANLAVLSELHAQPATIEESYPSTHQWIARREASVGPGSNYSAQALTDAPSQMHAS